MTRTVTALYETREQAERVLAALKAAKLGDHVDIHDESGHDSSRHPTILDWILDLILGHQDSHLYEQGLRRGHFLLTAKVDDLNETRAAIILDADFPAELRGADGAKDPDDSRVRFYGVPSQA